MINNEMAERFHKKAKEIYYRNFFILIKKLNSNEIINEDNELTSDELRSGLHTCITLFLKSIICRRNYLKLIQNENNYTDQYIIDNFDNLSTVDAKEIYKIVKNNFSEDINFENDYEIDFTSLYNEGFKIRNKYFHSSNCEEDKNEKNLKNFLAINQIFLNNKFKLQIYKDILKSFPSSILKDKNININKSNNELNINENNIINDEFLMYDSIRFIYFKIIINIFKELKEPAIRKKVFSLEYYNNRNHQYFCPNCTPYNTNHLSGSEYSHNYYLLDHETELNKNMKSLISINKECSLFKCICCNDEYFLKEKVRICTHTEDFSYKDNSIILPIEHYMIDNVCLFCGKENFGDISNNKNGIYSVSKIHINNQKNFKPNKYLFSDPRKNYILDKRREKYARRKYNILRRKKHAI